MYAETKIASVVFGVSVKGLRKSVERNSKKWEPLKTTFRGTVQNFVSIG